MLEKEYNKQIVGENQMEMTRFQKQCLLLEEQRQSEEAKTGSVGSNSPSGAVNARSPQVRKNTVRYKNGESHESENQAEFVDT